MSTPPNPQSPTSEAVRIAALSGWSYCPTAYVDGLPIPNHWERGIEKCFSELPPSPTLQAAAEALSRELVSRNERASVVASTLRHFAFVEELVRENEHYREGFFPETAALHAILKSAGCVSVREVDYEKLKTDLATARAERDAAVKDKEHLIRIGAAYTSTIQDLDYSLTEARQEASELRGGAALQAEKVRELFAKQAAHNAELTQKNERLMWMLDVEMKNAKKVEDGLRADIEAAYQSARNQGGQQ